QRSNDMLTGIAARGREKTETNKYAGFKLQGDSEYADNYWTPNHRLLDTAYVAAEFEIAEGDVTIPQLEFVVRGKELEQYNYDYSYRANPTESYDSDKRDLFKIGDTVDFYDLDGNALDQDIQISDLTKYLNSREEEVWKYRFASDPLEGSTTLTSFKMVQLDEAHDHSSAYEMVTWNHKAASSDSLTKTMLQAITIASGDGNGTVSANATEGIDISELSTDMKEWLSYLTDSGGITIALFGSTITITAEDILENLMQVQLDGGGSDPNVSGSGNTFEIAGAGGTSDGISELTGLLITNAIYLGDAGFIGAGGDLPAAD
ncbi:uncharacterized protein METZ01_LOCUS352801, partial [marine metagenome]